MSGTSLDGIDAALIRTDGEQVFEFGPWLSRTYDPEFRSALRALLGRDPTFTGGAAVVSDTLTRLHAEAVAALLKTAGMTPREIRVIGFHGHTVLHRPDLGVTHQIGDGPLLAKLTGVDVVGGLRLRDVASGGEGAPLAPAYHRALAADLPKPLAVLNLGGVANISWIGSDAGPQAGPGGVNGASMLAFDCGPGNALIDDWLRLRTGRAMDEGGALAAGGRADGRLVAEWLKNPFFFRTPPKSLDRQDFQLSGPMGDALKPLSDADGAATLVAFTAGAVAEAVNQLPARPERWLVTGGGRHNAALMAALATSLRQPVGPVEDVGWDGDALEAQAFGYLAMRSLRGLPITWPGTTGIDAPATGGVCHRAA